MNQSSQKPWWKWLASRCVVLVVVGFLLFQVLFMYILFMNHSFFKESLRDINNLTFLKLASSPKLTLSSGVNSGSGGRNSLRSGEVEKPRSFRHINLVTHSVTPSHRVEQIPNSHSLDKEHPLRIANETVTTAPKDEIGQTIYFQYHGYPVVFESSELPVPTESKQLLSRILPRLVHVSFPDLRYRSTHEVRAAHPKMFRELPLRFNERYKNPCWSSDFNNVVHCLPFVYLLGQPKSGTSDLFERLKAHHRIMAPRRKEIRWFTRGEFTLQAMRHEGDPISGGTEMVVRGKEGLLGSESSLLSFTQSFDSMQKLVQSDLLRSQSMGEDDNTTTLSRQARESITVDGGPHTLWWPTQAPDGSFMPDDIPPAQLLRELQPNARFVLTLNDPVQRLYSDFHFLGDNLKPVNSNPANSYDKSAKALHDRVVSQVSRFQQCVDQYMHLLLTMNSTREVPRLTLNLSNAFYEQHSSLWFRASQMYVLFPSLLTHHTKLLCNDALCYIL
jgi:hypothetical protein